MRSNSVNRRLSVGVIFAIGLLVAGLNAQYVNAVSTDYQVDSPRVSDITATGAQEARIENAHSISGDGRYVVFASQSNDLVVGDTNGMKDIFVRDTTSGVTTRVSVASDGTQSDSNSSYPAISYSGQYVVFMSTSSNLVSGVTGTTKEHVYIHDMVSGTTNIVDTSSSGSIGDGYASNPNTSADGRFVVFHATGTNLVPGISSASNYQIYIKDTHSGSIKALSITSAGVKGNEDSFIPDISCDGNIVVFGSSATNLGVPTGQPARMDVMVVQLGWSRDELHDITANLQNGAQGNIQVSCDGNKVLFLNSSTNVVPSSTPSGYVNAYVYNRLDNSFMQASLGDGDAQADNPQQYKSMNASMSGDGRYVAFTSFANNVDTSYPGSQASGVGASLYIRDTRKSTTDTVAVLSYLNKRSKWLSDQSRVVSLNGDGSIITFAHTTPGTSNPDRTLIDGYSTGSASGRYDVYSTTTGF